MRLRELRVGTLWQPIGFNAARGRIPARVSNRPASRFLAAPARRAARQPRREHAGDREQDRRRQEDSRSDGLISNDERRQPASEHERTGGPGHEADSEDDGGLAQHRQAHLRRQSRRAPSGSRSPACAGARCRRAHRTDPGPRAAPRRRRTRPSGRARIARGESRDRRPRSSAPPGARPARDRGGDLGPHVRENALRRKLGGHDLRQRPVPVVGELAMRRDRRPASARRRRRASTSPTTPMISSPWPPAAMLLADRRCRTACPETPLVRSSRSRPRGMARSHRPAHRTCGPPAPESRAPRKRRR